MKKAFYVVLVFVCITLMVGLLSGCDHDDTTQFVMADISEISFEELLSPPYVTLEKWSFVDSWGIECNGKSLDPINAEEDLYLEITEGLREILKDETLYTYVPEGKVRNYDKHVKELLWEQEYLMRLRMGAAIIGSVQVQADDLVPNSVWLYCLDGSRCYLTIGYQKGTVIKRNHYVFYTDDPALINELFLFAEGFL